jgi:hypothetical protein
LSILLDFPQLLSNLHFNELFASHPDLDYQPQRAGRVNRASGFRAITKPCPDRRGFLF